MNIKNDKVKYQKVVRLLSEFNYKRYKGIIDPDKIRSSKFHMDHRLSVRNAYADACDVFIPCHPANLEIIPAAENMRKGRKNSRDLPYLLKDIKEFNGIYGEPEYELEELILFSMRRGRR